MVPTTFVLCAALLAHDPLAEECEDRSNREPECIVLCQEKEEDDFARAKRLLYDQKPRAAIDAFRAVVAEDPANGVAWFYLGYCLHVVGWLDDALATHIRAAEVLTELLETQDFGEDTARIERHRASALYNAACACALLDKKEEAFGWLELAFEQGFENRMLLSRDPDLKSLHGDPRFASYLPAEAEASGLFQGNVRLLYTFVGESAGDQFGWKGRNAGDCNGDGVDDIVISAPYKKVRGANAGRVYAFSGATGELLFARDGAPGELFGVGLEAAGDVNADGAADVIVGATLGGEGAGRAYVLSGRDGETLLELSAREEGDYFGWKVAGVGDFDGDGHDDVAVGAPGSDEVGRDTGRAYVFSGADGSLLVAVDGENPGDELGSCVAGAVWGEERMLVIGAGDAGPRGGGRVYVFEYTDQDVFPLFHIEADETGVDLGRMFLSIVGDVNGDGVPDVYASDWENHARGKNTGRVYVHSGSDGERLLTLTGEHSGDGFGIGSAQAGDVDGDGLDDLIIGAWRSSQGAPSAGKCYLFSGDGTLLEEYVCTAAGAAFGFDAVGMGDLDGDGGQDFLVTSAWSDAKGKKTGRAFVIAGPLLDVVRTSRQED
jgi:hypothetical protein